MKTTYLLLFFLLHASISYTQQNFVLNGKIADADTKQPLQDVRIYKIFNGDTITTQCNLKGEFQISLNTDSKLLFKKRGYAWHIIKITNREPLQIYLKPTTLTMNMEKEKVDNTDFYINGHLVPREEMEDALGIISGGLVIDGGNVQNIITRKIDGRDKIYFTIVER